MGCVGCGLVCQVAVQVGDAPGEEAAVGAHGYQMLAVVRELQVVYVLFGGRRWKQELGAMLGVEANTVVHGRAVKLNFLGYILLYLCVLLFKNNY